MRRPGGARGFTLIELMIVVAMLGILIEVLPSLFRGLHQVRRISETHVEIARSTQTLDAALGRDVRGAGAVVGRFRDFSASASCLILEAPRVATGGRLVLGEPDHIIYALDRKDPARLLKHVFPSAGSRRGAARQVLAANVLSLRFTAGAGAKLVGWEASFGAPVEHRVIRRTFSSAAGLRTAGL